MMKDDLKIAQYNALRQEILDLHLSNDRIYSNTIVLVGLVWSTLLTIIFSDNNLTIPGIIFLFPTLHLISSLSRHITSDNRVTNISSFIGVTYQSSFKKKSNWETRIGDFARSKKFDLNSKFSNMFVYSFLFWVSCGFSVIGSIIFGIGNEWNEWAIFDIILSSILVLIFIVLFISVKKSFVPFGERKKMLDEIWNEI